MIRNGGNEAVRSQPAGNIRSEAVLPSLFLLFGMTTTTTQVVGTTFTSRPVQVTTVVVTAVQTSPSSSPSLSSSSSSSSTSGLSVGAIVGIVIGTSVVLIALVVLLIWFYRRQTRPPRVRYYNERPRTQSDTSPRAALLYEPVGAKTHSRDASSISQWLQRQPSKYSVVSMYPTRTEDWQHEPFEGAIPTSPTNKITLSELPQLAVPTYQPPPSIISQNAHISVAMSAPPATPRSDSLETASVYSQGSEAAAQSSAATRTSPAPALSTSVAIVASPSPHPHPRLLDDETYDTLKPLQLSPIEEPQVQLERGNTRVISHLLLDRTKQGLRRNSSTVSHIEREGEITEGSPVVDPTERERQRRYTPAWARTNPRVPAPRSSFDVDLPTGLELSRTT